MFQFNIAFPSFELHRRPVTECLIKRADFIDALNHSIILTVSDEGSSPTRNTRETSQILLAVVSCVFLGAIFCHFARYAISVSQLIAQMLCTEHWMKSPIYECLKHNSNIWNRQSLLGFPYIYN